VKYRARSIHKIAPRPDDWYDGMVEIEITPQTPRIATWLARILRDAKILMSGQRLRSWRVEKDGRIVAFPMNWNGLTCMPHSIILEPQKEEVSPSS
jgi:hypothetical protein